MPEPTALFVIHDLGPGGAERVFLQYLEHLRGVRVVPVLVRPRGDWLGRLPSGIPVHHLEAGGEEAATPAELACAGRRARPERESLWASATGIVRKAKRLARIAEAEDARLVSTFLHKSHAIALTARRLFAPELRIVVNVHEQPLRHVETHFALAPTARPTPGGEGISTADRVVAVAPGIAGELESIGRYPPGRLVVAPNPVDAEAIRVGAEEPLPPSELPPGEEPLVVGVGRLMRIKGFDLLLEATAAADRRWRLVIVGDGDERDALRTLAEERGLGDRVRFAGHRENPYPWIEAADLLALPSRTDAWPTVIAEAFALGTPVVAARCSASVEEFLGHGERGTLVAADDVEALRRGITDALDRPDEIEAGAKRACAWIERYTPAAASRHYAGILLEVCG